jgi:hypothetical protein
LYASFAVMDSLVALRGLFGSPGRRFAVAALLLLLVFLIVPYYREQAIAVVPLRAKLTE